MLKITQILFVAFLLNIPLFGQQVVQGDVNFDDKKDSSVDDMEALRRWIRDKRLVTIKEIGGDLSLSGKVRTEFQDINERRDGIKQRGRGGVYSEKPQYAWDVEFDLMIDYRTDRTWASVKLEFDNDMGQRSGTMNKISLGRAYLGGRIIAGDTLTIDSELGRRFLFDVFDSKIEFSSLFDGVLFRFNKAFPSLGDYYFNSGALLVDDKTNHYAYIAEMGGLGIANIGLNMKYSIVDWYKPSANVLTNARYKYLVSQIITSYQFYPEWIGKRLIKFYGAGLCNHLASGYITPGITITHGERQNWGCYAGMSIGVVKKQYDWAIDANYQWVQAQAIPDFDVSGIGRGNAGSVGLYTINANGDPNSGATTYATAVGSCNYKGFIVDTLYAFTDNMTVQQTFKLSNTLNKNIGPNLKYRQYEIEFIYAF